MGITSKQVRLATSCPNSKIALKDLEPLLKRSAKRAEKKPAEFVIYDPYYCDGGKTNLFSPNESAIRSHLNSLGFPNVINENVDFYSSPIPSYDFLMTNPPYSGEHKQRILQFCVKQRRPFALLLPNYVAVKSYFKVVGRLDCTGSNHQLANPDLFHCTEESVRQLR